MAVKKASKNRVHYQVKGKAQVEPEAVSQNLTTNMTWLKQYLGYKESFDILVRDFKIGSRRAAIICVDSFIDSTLLTLIMDQLQKASEEAVSHTGVQAVLSQLVPYVEVTPETKLDQTADQILAGPIALLIDGLSHAIVVDIRKYPGRQPSEPSIERVLRGPQDGFVETLVFNTILVRRRLRDPNLRMEAMQVGRRSKSDVVIMYIKDIANEFFVSQIRQRLKDINVDALTMSEKAIQEWIVRKPWWNPFPNGKFTERPDVAAEHLTEGHVLVMIDTTPNALILPVTFFSFLQSVEEYHEDIMVGTYLKWVRFVGVFMSWVLPPLWYALVVTHAHLPGAADILLKPKVLDIPLFWQLVGLEVGVDLLRLALTFSPDPLTQSMGFFGAILLGDVAIKAKLIDAEAMVLVALAAVGTFTAPDIDFGMAIRLLRGFLLLMTGVGTIAALTWGGFAAGLIVPLIMLLTMNSFGVSYVWPLIPFDFRGVLSQLSRKPLNRKYLRPALTLPRDRTHRRPREREKV